MLWILRGGLAVFVGLLVGFLIVAGGEMVGHHVSPPPPGMDPSKPETIAAVMKQIPAAAFVPMLLAWAAGTFAGSWVASRIASRWKLIHGLIVGGAFLAATVAILVSIPHPVWVSGLGVVETLALGYLGAKLASRDRTSPTVSA